MREDIYSVLKSRIINLEYKPNEILKETAIASEFAVSRTPIREIFIHLACESLIIFTPGNSIRVSDINLQGFQELISYRIVLEKGVARLIGLNATENDLLALASLRKKIERVKREGNVEELINCDAEFHQITRRAARNSLLDKNLEMVHLQFTRIQKLIGHKPDKMILDLDTLIESAKKKDFEKIENILVDHVYNFVEVMNKYFSIT